MRFLLYIFVWLGYPLFCLGQSNDQIERESLIEIWKNTSEKDIDRLKAINKVCDSKFIYTHSDTALLYSEEAYKLAKRNDLKKEMANASYSKGLANSNLSKFQNAKISLQESIDLRKKIKDTLGLAKSINCLGNTYLKQSDFTQAIEHYRESLILFEKISNKKGTADSQNNIGLVFYDLKEFEKSLEYLNKALLTYKDLKDEKGEANTLINIGSVYRQQKDYKSALEFYEKGLQLKKKHGVKIGIAICQSNIGLVYKAQEDSEKALRHFNLSLDLHKAVGNKKGIANCLIYLASIHTDSNKIINLAKEALDIAKESGYSEEIINAGEILYKNYENIGQLKKALEIYKLTQQTKSKIYGTKVQKSIHDSEQKYNEDRIVSKEQLGLQKEIKAIKVRSRIERFAFFGILLSASAFLIFSFRKKQRKYVEKQNKLNTKIESLKEKLATQSTIVAEKRKELALDKSKIEKAIDSKLGESSWEILNILFQDPSISNKDIANKVSLSLEGVSSSLRRMYTAFGLQSGNKKVALIMKAIRISLEE